MWAADFASVLQLSPGSVSSNSISYSASAQPASSYCHIFASHIVSENFSTNMAGNKSKENKELQVLNDRLAEYIEKIKNQTSNQQGPELISIYDLMEEKMTELRNTVDSEKKTAQDPEMYERRVQAEKDRRKAVEDQLDVMTTEKITAELDCEFEKKRNGLLQKEIECLKEIYEKKIRELQTPKQQNLTEEDGDGNELRKVLQEMREQEKRITLGEQKKKMADMEKQFKKMMENLTGYEEAVNKKLDLQEEIECYQKLLEQMKKRVDLKEKPSQNEPNKGTQKTPGAGGNQDPKDPKDPKVTLKS